MRLLIIAVLSAFATTAVVSVGHAQTDTQVAANPSSEFGTKDLSGRQFLAECSPRKRNSLPCMQCRRNNQRASRMPQQVAAAS